MILGPQDYGLVGAQGSALTVYKLRRLGIQALEVGENQPFDVLAFSDNRVIRIQCKATQAAVGSKYLFMTSRGRFATLTKHSASLTEYTDREVDLIALVALPLDKILFKPIQEIVNTKTRVSARKFKQEDLEHASFEVAVRSVFGKA